MLVWWFVVDGFDLGVVMWFTASELEASDLASGEIYCEADESMRPSGIECEAVPQQRCGSLIVRTTDEDHSTLKLPLNIQSLG